MTAALAVKNPRAFVASAKQQRFFEWVAVGSGSAILKAVAGSGKSTSIVRALTGIPETATVLILAFNAPVAKEMREKIVAFGEEVGRPFRNVEASTFHSRGFRALCKRWPRDSKVEVDGGKVRKILKDRLSEHEYEMYGDFVDKLVGYAKGVGVGIPGLAPDEYATWSEIIATQEMWLDDEEATEERAIDVARKALRASNLKAEAEKWVDYNDQLYLPLLWNLRLFQHDWVMVDECFVPETPILIGLDGAQMTIKEMYDSQYTGPIVTWSESRGSHIGNVVGAKRVVVGKPMVRIRTRQIGYAKDGSRLGALTEHVRFKTRTLVCTEDHKIWATDGWVSAGKLKPGTIVKHETSAKVVRHYQSSYAHTPKGREALVEKADITRLPQFVPSEFKNRGGNGCGPTSSERLLQERLGAEWETGVVIATGAARKNYKPGKVSGVRGLSKGSTFSLGHPTGYKLDLVNKNCKTVIEVDGKSHNAKARREQDARKDAWLRKNGWKVIRITNEEARSLTDAALKKLVGKCAVDAFVVSVEPWKNRKHEYVYDLSVKDTHCYFAHGLLVHNCQDTNPVRRLFARRSLKPSGRFVGVGDPCQSIYAFTGANSNAMDLIAAEFHTIELPLTTSYRCPKAVGELARALVPYFEVADTNPEGEVEWLPAKKAIAKLSDSDAVLCRQTAPLISLAFSLIAEGRGCFVLGKDIGAGLANLIKKLRPKGVPNLIERLDAWVAKEAVEAEKAGKPAKAEAAADRAAAIRVVADSIPEADRTVPAVLARIADLFGEGDGGGRLTLSTIHKAKGREWVNVAVLAPELSPSKAAKSVEAYQQELNLQYVRDTRTKFGLYFMEGEYRA